jgi:predicted Zn-dependent protease with MMP-like domain
LYPTPVDAAPAGGQRDGVARDNARDDLAESLERAAQNGVVIEMSRERFEELVAAALDEIPEELTRLMDNVVVLVEDDPPPGEPDLLGVYDGLPLTERDHSYGGVLPDRITIFRNPTLRICETDDDVIDEVHITVVHEIAHHFGIDDERLHELGYG